MALWYSELSLLTNSFYTPMDNTPLHSISSVGTHGDVSWVGSPLRSPVLVALHLLALQLKPSLPGLGIELGVTCVGASSGRMYFYLEKFASTSIFMRNVPVITVQDVANETMTT